MTAVREPIWAALFALLQGATTTPGVVTFSRRLRHWSEVQPAEQPALYLTQTKNPYTQRRGLPPKIELNGEIVVYVLVADDDKASPDTQMNAILDAIDTALAPSPATETQTLGGLVSHAWISGAVETSGGLLGAQAVAVIPISILINT